MSNYGLFSASSSLYVGDPYGAKQDLSDRLKGKQFLTNPPTKGKGVDSILDKTFRRLSENDQYVDPGSEVRKAMFAAEKKRLSDKAFFPTSPAKKGQGWKGCIGKPPEFMGEVTAVDKEGPEPRNFLTSPAPKGSYGTPNTTLGKPLGYVPEQYMPARELDKAEINANREKILKPFLSVDKGQNIFDGNKTKSYAPGDDLPLPKDKPPKFEKPFRPGNPPKKGKAYCTLEKFPAHVDDPRPKPPAGGEIFPPQPKFEKPFRPNNDLKSFPVTTTSKFVKGMNC